MFTLLLGGLIVLLSAVASLQNPVPYNYTRSILQLAKTAQLKAYIDPNADACFNFYEYACGEWAHLHRAQAHMPKTTYLDIMQEVYVRKTIDLLDGDLGRDVIMQKDDDKVDQLLKKFYDSCRNNEAQANLGIEPILQAVDMKGGWPVITSESWYEYEYDWLRKIAELRQKLGVDILLGLEVIPDFKDKDMHRMKVGAPQLTLATKAAYLNEDYGEERENFKENIVNKLSKYFPKMPHYWAKEVAAQVLDLEQQLAKGLPDNTNLTMKQTTRERYTADLRDAYGSYVDVSRYLNIIYNQTIYMQVYETPEDYISNLVEVIKRTPKLTIANYTMWRVLDKFDYAGDHKWCFAKLMEYFPYQLESLFHRNYNNMLVMNELRSVWFDIKETFRKELQDGKAIAWMTLETREKAIVKLQEMDLEILLHQERNNHFKERAIGVLQLNKDTYYHNMLNILEWQTEQQLAKLLEKPEDTENDIRLPAYKYTTNKIQIPITFLQTRFFWDPAYPVALKYSTIGFFLAQQMLKGFESVGRKYDNRGYKRNWWDDASQKGFEEISNCFRQQNGNYTLHGTGKLHDPNALTKSITDSSGLAIAYRTYQKWRDNKSKVANETLPHFDYTPNQTFLIGFAQLWCADYYDSAEDDYTELPESMRLNGALMNLKEFAADFECNSDAAMNPSPKCITF